MVDWNFLLTIVIASAALVAALFAIYQSYVLRKTVHLQAVLELLRQYTVDFWDERNIVTFELPGKIEKILKDNPGTNFSTLPQKYRNAVRRVSFFFDLLGFLVHHGFLDETIIASFIGGAAIVQFRTLKPLIDNERKLRSDGRFQMYFEDFVVNCLRRPLSELTEFKRLSNNDLDKMNRFARTGHDAT